MAMPRLRLFFEDDLSPLSLSALMPVKGDDDTQAVSTPSLQGGNSVTTCDEDSGLGWDGDKGSPFFVSCSVRVAAIMEDVTIPKASTLSPSEFLTRRHENKISLIHSMNYEESMSGMKRPLTDIYTPVFKKSRDSNAILDDRDVNVEEYACSTWQKSTIDAVDRLSDEPELTADGSRPYCLPTIPDGSLGSWAYSDDIEHFTIIDCRYPYEYNGGHIKGAVNMYRREEIQELLLRPNVQSWGKNGILIFHCEFSSERGPKLYRFLRGLDRNLHKENYPQLLYPEVYLLDGGYKAFFESYKELCEPDNYTSMLHNDHSEDLRHFRVKSKSWAAGEKRRQFRQALRF